MKNSKTSIIKSFYNSKILLSIYTELKILIKIYKKICDKYISPSFLLDIKKFSLKRNLDKIYFSQKYETSQKKKKKTV